MFVPSNALPEPLERAEGEIVLPRDAAAQGAALLSFTPPQATPHTATCHWTFICVGQGILRTQ